MKKLAVMAAAIALVSSALATSSAASGEEADARDLDPEVSEQIEILLVEKASRTPTEMKIDSSLLYEIKRDRDDPLFDAVPDLRTNVVVDRDDRVLVDIDTEVDEVMLGRIVALGGVVVNGHPCYRAIRRVSRLT